METDIFFLSVFHIQWQTNDSKKNQLGHFKKCDYIHVNKIQEKQQKQNKMPAWSLPTPVPTSALRKNP